MGTGFSPFPEKGLGLGDFRWGVGIQAGFSPRESKIGTVSHKHLDEKANQVKKCK